MHFNRVRHLLVALVAVFAFSAVAAASASAHTYVVCKETGTEKYTEHLCKTKGETGKWSFAELTAAEKVEGTSGVSKLESNLGGVRVIIECKKDKLTGEIEGGGKSKDTVITYEECSLFQVVKHVKEALTTCVVPNIKTKALKDLLIAGKGIGPEEEFEPETGTTFTEITIETCALASKTAVTGKQICQLPEATVGKVEHEIECSPTGGELRLGKEAASYYGTATAKLVNGWSWAAE